jgi:BirA family biotin operon repressor/biotin-[acetyl-CoA-carboxylase] ligase
MTHSDPKTLEFFETVASTMDVARDALMSGRIRYDQAGRLRYRGVMAAEQTTGRGQRGREWYAAPGDSLCATYYFRHGRIEPQTAGQIALLAGVAAADALQRVCLERCGIPTSDHSSLLGAFGLKWPNDLILNGRKLGGILVELANIPEAGWVALIGVGLNVNVAEFPPELSSTATSLLREGLPGVSCPHLAERIADSLDALAQRQEQAGFDAILLRWRAYDLSFGRLYEALTPEGRQIGTADGIDETGALRLRLPDSSVLIVNSASAVRESSPL